MSVQIRSSERTGGYRQKQKTWLSKSTKCVERDHSSCWSRRRVSRLMFFARWWMAGETLCFSCYISRGRTVLASNEMWGRSETHRWASSSDLRPLGIEAFCTYAKYRANFNFLLSLLLDAIYKVVQIWPGLIVCKQVTVSPGHIWTTLYNSSYHVLNGVWYTHTSAAKAYKGKKKFALEQATKAQKYTATPSLTSALGWWLTPRPGRFTPEERRPGTYWTEGWFGARPV